MDVNLKFSNNALRVLQRRYLQKNDQGQVIETPAEMISRVARAISAVERRYGASKQAVSQIEEEFFSMMAGLEFMPNSPTLMNAGKELGQLSACFVVPIEDSMESIFDAIKATALIHKTGGGTGFSFSSLRSRKSIVKSTGGFASGPVSFMKVFDSATQAVKQGGTRRGANMGILRIDHPDILDFIQCKEKEGDISNFNISIALTADFMEKVFTHEKYDLVDPCSKEVKKTLDASEVFDLIARNAWANGEPGIVFIDRINEMNPTPHLGAIESTNPCLPKDVWIMTENGPRLVAELIGKKCAVIVDGEKFESTDAGFFCTGLKPVYRLSTEEGYGIDLTLDHPLLKMQSRTRAGQKTEWVRAEQLNPGDRVVLNDHLLLSGWPGEYSYEEGYAVGLLFGDGTLKKDKAVLCSWEKDKGAESVRQRISRITDDFPHRRDFSGWMQVKSRGEYRLASGHLRKVCMDLGFSGQKDINVIIEQASSDFYKGFLSGFFDADGSVQGTQEKGVSIRLAQSDLPLLRSVQRMLLRLGICSTLYANRRTAGQRSLPDGKGGEKEYQIRAQHELVISGANIAGFADKIGFINSCKDSKLKKLLSAYKRNFNKEWFCATVQSLEFRGMEKVYDLQVPGINMFDADGFKVHNCGEQPLLAYESCNLGSINLARMLKQKGDEFAVDWDKLAKTSSLSCRFLDNVIDANKFPLPQIKDRTQQTRKIGLGVMGWATMLGYLGIEYDSEEALELARKVMDCIYTNARDTSIFLGRERGVFPAWKGSAWEKRGQRIRNASLTTIAPTGSISIIGGPTSTGIEPFFSLVYFRNVMDGDKLLEIEPSFEHVARQRGFYSEELMQRIGKGESIQKMPEIPEDVKRIFKTALEIEPLYHVKMQATFQEFTDNAVSKTINLPNEALVDDVKDAYIYAYKMGCKGITVYRDGSRDIQVLTVDRKDKNSSSDKTAATALPKPRPEVMGGTTTKITTGCGNLYVTINQDEQGRFFEVFTEMGKAGGCAASQLEAIGRLISLAMRGGLEIKAIIEQLKGIRCPSPNWMKGQKIFSCADAIARVLEMRLADQKQIVRIKLSSRAPESVKAASPAVKAAGRSSTVVGVCPDCGAVLRHEEGCAVCTSCGYSKC